MVHSYRPLVDPSPCPPSSSSGGEGAHGIGAYGEGACRGGPGKEGLGVVDVVVAAVQEEDGVDQGREDLEKAYLVVGEGEGHHHHHLVVLRGC